MTPGPALMARLVSIQVGVPRWNVSAEGERWRSAFFKEPVAGPLALDLTATDAILAAVARAGVRLQVGLMRRHDPDHVRARARIVAGELGRALGLRIPELVRVELDPGFANAEPDEEIHDLLGRSGGSNLGVDFLPGALPFNPAAGPPPPPALAADIVPTVWKAYPFFTLTLLAALQAIPASLYEAARVDGATSWQRFRYITWPGIRPSATLAAILNTLWALREFDIIYLTTGGGPDRATETLAVRIYQEAFSFFRMGTASALGVLTMTMAVLLVLMSMRTIRREYF